MSLLYFFCDAGNPHTHAHESSKKAYYCLHYIVSLTTGTSCCSCWSELLLYEHCFGNSTCIRLCDEPNKVRVSISAAAASDGGRKRYKVWLLSPWSWSGTSLWQTTSWQQKYFGPSQVHAIFSWSCTVQVYKFWRI